QRHRRPQTGRLKGPHRAQRDISGPAGGARPEGATAPDCAVGRDTVRALRVSSPLASDAGSSERLAGFSAEAADAVAEAAVGVALAAAAYRRAALARVDAVAVLAQAAAAVGVGAARRLVDADVVQAGDPRAAAHRRAVLT